jgi:radical SAM superfamily enzyme with C-terminal helix-hairpin-helix motif
MKRTVVRYKTKPESTDENRRLVEKVFQELQTTLPAGVRYAALQLADGTFIHLVETEDGAKPLPELDAFRKFQAGIKERCLEGPQPGEATIVGNYRMLAARKADDRA